MQNAQVSQQPGGKRAAWKLHCGMDRVPREGLRERAQRKRLYIARADECASPESPKTVVKGRRLLAVT